MPEALAAAPRSPALDERSLILPPPLRPGDRVGVMAPSLPLAARYPGRFARGVEALAALLGVEVVVAGQCYTETGFTAGSPEERASALLTMVEDPKIAAIFCAIGGFNSAEILPFLDTATLRAHPKAFVGYSDATSLLLGLQALGGWVTFHGPAVMPQMGEFPEPFPFTADSLRSALAAPDHPRELADPEGWTDEFLDWGTGAWLARPRQMRSPATREVWRPGEGRGRLFGGNIETLNLLFGTPYFLPPHELILFWEANAEEAFLPRIRRALTQLRQAGLFDRTRGMLVGRSPDATAVGGVDLKATVLEAVAGYDFPVVGELAFGHTDPMLTLPVGLRMEVEAHPESARLALLGL